MRSTNEFPVGNRPTRVARMTDDSDSNPTTTLDGTPTSGPPGFVVSVIEGPDAGRSVTVADGLFVGKSEVCELVLVDKKVSRRHAYFAFDPLGLRIRDEGSTNGTYLNGNRIVEALARDGDRVRVGDTLIAIAAETRAPASEPLTTRTRFGRMMGASTAMRRLFARCDQVAATGIPVLIEGETGTGKELLAEAIHEAGARGAKPFVVLDCTTVSPQLLEASLFGHERGAFTGAQEARPGVFEVANGGTLLIDEIGDLDISLQAKLLRAVERQEVQRIGATKWTKIDIRLISATRRDLEAEIQAGRFRDDLYYRLAVARLAIPPLRTRDGDVEFLATHFWSRFSGGSVPFPRDFLTRWQSYRWPGNVRELSNAVQRRFALGQGEGLDDDAEPSLDLGASVAQTLIEQGVPYSIARRKVIDEFERLFVGMALDKTNGSVAKAAAAYGIARRHFTRIKSRST